MSRPRRGEKGHEEANRKWRKTMEEKYGDPSAFMKKIGAIGGRNGHTGGFAANPELAKIAGSKGGKISKRGPAKRKTTPHITNEEVEETKQKGKWKWPFLGRKDK